MIKMGSHNHLMIGMIDKLVKKKLSGIGGCIMYRTSGWDSKHNSADIAVWVLSMHVFFSNYLYYLIILYHTMLYYIISYYIRLYYVLLYYYILY